MSFLGGWDCVEVEEKDSSKTWTTRLQDDLEAVCFPHKNLDSPERIKIPNRTVSEEESPRLRPAEVRIHSSEIVNEECPRYGDSVRKPETHVLTVDPKVATHTSSQPQRTFPSATLPTPPQNRQNIPDNTANNLPLRKEDLATPPRPPVFSRAHSFQSHTKHQTRERLGNRDRIPKEMPAVKNFDDDVNRLVATRHGSKYGSGVEAANLSEDSYVATETSMDSGDLRTLERGDRSPDLCVGVMTGSPNVASGTEQQDRFSGDAFEGDSRSTDRALPLGKRNYTRKERHFRWFAHGKMWTSIAVLLSICGSLMSVLSRRSTRFVVLSEPLNIAPVYNAVDKIGMIRMELCYNTSVVSESGCTVIPLTTEDVDDNMFELARIFLTLSALSGVFFTIFLCSAVYWQSINLKPIGIGFIVTYFFQSFSMIFFDSMICSDKNCRVGSGSLLSIFASLCWIGACLATAKMDAFKIIAQRRRRRHARRLAKTRKMVRKASSETVKTTSSRESDGSNSVIDLEVNG